MTLRWKLVLLYALILAAVIGGFGLMLVYQVMINLVEATVTELWRDAHTLGAALEFEDGAWRLDPESELVREYLDASGRYVVITARSDSKTVIASPASEGLGRLGPSEKLEVAVPFSKTDEPPAATESRPFEVVVTCGKSSANIDAAVAAVTHDVLVIGPLVLLASLLGGWFLVSRALRPIDQIAQAAAEINATDLSKRIPVHGNDELARLSKTLNETFDRLQHGFERERRFTADASHELRTPLAAITGNVEVALNKERPEAEYREILTDVGGAANRMQQIVEGLLALARQEGKPSPASREPVVLARLVEDAIRMHRSLAAGRHVTVSAVAPEDVAVEGDAEHLRTVVSNLIANAIRYNVDGGRVAIEVARAGGRVRIRVDDTGVGIPEKDLPHVFERFYRADQSRTTAGGGGVGLGLAISKAIVEAHHGTISVSRLPDGGTRFEVGLPG